MSKYTAAQLAQIDKFKRYELRNFDSSFIKLIEEYARVRPYEFPTMEHDIVVGHIVKGKNYNSPESKIKEVLSKFLHAKEFSYQPQTLLMIEQYKNRELKNYDSTFLNQLVQYAINRPWEFKGFENDARIGDIVKKHFDPNSSEGFSWLSKIAQIAEAPSPPEESESSFPPKPEPTVTPPVVLQAATPKQKPPILMMLVGSAVVAYALWTVTKSKS